MDESPVHPKDNSEIDDKDSPEFEDEAEDFEEDHVGEEEMPRKDALGSGNQKTKSSLNEKRGSKSRSLRRRRAAPRISVNQSSISVAQARGHKGRPSNKPRNSEKKNVTGRMRESWFPSSDRTSRMDLNHTMGARGIVGFKGVETKIHNTSSVFEATEGTLEARDDEQGTIGTAPRIKKSIQKKVIREMNVESK